MPVKNYVLIILLNFTNCETTVQHSCITDLWNFKVSISCLMHTIQFINKILNKLPSEMQHDKKTTQRSWQSCAVYTVKYVQTPTSKIYQQAHSLYPRTHKPTSTIYLHLQHLSNQLYKHKLESTLRVHTSTNVKCTGLLELWLPQPKLIWDSNRDFNIDPDPCACRIAPKM